MDTLDVEIRFEEDPERLSPGLLSGVLIRYGDYSRSHGEQIMAGALYWPDDGIVVNEMHVRENPIVRVTPFLDGDELRIAQRLPNTSRGRDSAENLRERVFLGLSVEMERGTVQAHYTNGVRQITRAKLVRAALVDTPSYQGSVAEVTRCC